MIPVLMVGAPSGSMACLEQVLSSKGAHVCRISEPEKITAWLQSVQQGGAVHSRPRLVIVSAQLAEPSDGDALAALGAVQPWRFLPRVVISEQHDVTSCNRAYQDGAASWVVFPSDAQAAFPYAEAFATYWIDSVLLPAGGPGLS